MSPPGVHIEGAALSRSITALAELTAHPAAIEDGVAAVIGATRALFAVTGAGLMLVDEHGSLRHVGATDPPARVLEEAQEDLSEGPGIDCLVLGSRASSDDIAADERWPGLRERVVPAGVRAVLAVAVRLGGSPVGSLTVYRETPYSWDDSDRGAIEAYGDVAERLLGAALAERRSGVLVAQLQAALDRRVVIERAVGVLMERHGVGPVIAFGAMRRAARDARRPVADLAAETLEGGESASRAMPQADPDPERAT